MIHSVLFVLFVVACDCQSFFLLRFEHMPSPIPHTSKSLLLSLSPSLSVCPLVRPFLVTLNWLFLQPCTISPLFALESPPCCIQFVELSEALWNSCAYHLLFLSSTPQIFPCLHWHFHIPYLTNTVKLL